MYSYSDDNCNSLTIGSTWRNRGKMVDCGSQTSEESACHSFESATQSGMATGSVDKEVKAKDENASLLAYCKGRIKKYDDETWLGLLEAGKVATDGQVNTNAAHKVKAGSVISYTDYQKDAGIQTQTHPSAAMEGIDDDEEDAKEAAKSAPALRDFLDRTAPIVCDQLAANIATKHLFDSYEATLTALLPDGYTGGATEVAASGTNVTYMHTLTVDFERHKIIFPDWTAGAGSEGGGEDRAGGRGGGLSGGHRYYNARVLRAEKTRVGDRIYDLEVEGGAHGHGHGQGQGQGSKLSAVREDCIRIPRASVAGGGGGVSGYGTRNTPAAPVLSVGIRVFARDSSGGGRGGRGGGDDEYFYPGTIERCHKSTYDVKLFGSGIVFEGITADDILSSGLHADQAVETRKPYIPELQCTGCTWSPSGSSVAVCYGKASIRGWCSTPGCVAIWNLFGRHFDPACPTYLLDHPSAITVVKFHPEKPSIVVAGTVNGEIIVWDLANNSSLTSNSTGSGAGGGVGGTGGGVTYSVEPAAISTISEFGHKEPVMDFNWLLNPGGGSGSGGGGKGSKYGGVVLPDSFWLTSVAADGKLLFWSLGNRLAHPIKGYTLGAGPGHRSSSIQYPTAYGGSCLAFSGRTATSGAGVFSSSIRPKWLLVGEEGGHLLRAQVTKLAPSAGGGQGGLLTADVFKKATYASDVYTSISKHGGGGGESKSSSSSSSAGLFYYDSHVGNVNSLDVSPFHRSLFASAGNDGVVKVYHLLERLPVRVYEIGGNCGSGSGGGSVGMTTLVTPTSGGNAGAGAGAQGSGGGSSGGSTFASISSVRFSPVKPTVFAAASMDGCVYIYDLASQSSSPIYALDSCGGWVSAGAGGATGADSMITAAAAARHGGHSAPSGAFGVTGVAFNAKQKHLLVSCDVSGRAHVWRLNRELTVRGGAGAGSGAGDAGGPDEESAPSAGAASTGSGTSTGTSTGTGSGPDAPGAGVLYYDSEIALLNRMFRGHGVED